MEFLLFLDGLISFLQNVFGSLFDFLGDLLNNLLLWFKNSLTLLVDVLYEFLMYFLEFIADYSWRFVELLYELILSPVIDPTVEKFLEVASSLQDSFPDFFTAATAINGYIDLTLIIGSFVAGFTLLAVIVPAKFLIKICPFIG